MTWNDPSAIDGVTLSALEWRRLQSGILSHDTDPVSARPGVLAGLATTVAALTVTVAAGSAVVTPSVGSNGSYIGVNDAAVTLAATAQDVTYARIDRVVLRAYDNAVDGSGQAKLVAEIITGVPAAAPAAPALPAGRLEISQLQVPKAGAGALTVVDKRTWTGPMGAPVVCNSIADLPAGTHLRPGMSAVIGSGATFVEYTYDGLVWVFAGSPVFASIGARDAALAAPAVGMVCMVGTDEYRCLAAGVWKLWSRPRQSYVQTFANMPTSSVDAYYQIIDGWVHLTFAATASGPATGLVSFTAPVTPAAGYPAYVPIGQVVSTDMPSIGRYVGTIICNGGANMLPLTSAAGGVMAYINATAPFTWASTDLLTGSMVYAAA